MDCVFTIPDCDSYTRQIHGTRPKCVIPLQDKYKRGYKPSQDEEHENDVAFYNQAKLISKESFRTFISLADLDKAKLESYLKSSQNDKIYMLYKDGIFHMDKMEEEMYMLK